MGKQGMQVDVETYCYHGEHSLDVDPRWDTSLVK